MALSKSSSAAPTKMRLHTTAAPMERKDETRVKGFDLPPGAGRGTDDKGHVSLTVDGLEWQLRGAPPWVRVTARWWGDELSDKRTRPWAKLVDGPGASASMTFPVKAKPAGFSRYCRDARAVVLEFSDGRTARHIASASVDVSRLEVHRPVTRHEVQLTTKAGGALGCVRVECVLDYVTGAVSSFELNEHLSKMDDTLPLAPPPSIRTPEAGRKEREEKAVASKKTSSAPDPASHVVVKPARWKARTDGTGKHLPGKENDETNHQRREGERDRTRALAEARDARRKAAANEKPPASAKSPSTKKPSSARKKRGSRAPSGVLEMAEQLRAEMDDALDAADGDDTLEQCRRSNNFAAFVSATASDSLGSWWRDSTADTSASASLTASTMRRFLPPDEDDDAALVADQALLDELFAQGLDGVFDDEESIDKGHRSSRSATYTGSRPDAYAVSSSVGRLALEAEAELEADLAEAEAYGQTGDGHFRGDDANHRVAESTLGRSGPELELKLTAHAGLVRALEQSIALDGSVSTSSFEPLVAVLKGGFSRGKELGRVVLDAPGSRGAGEIRLRLPRDVAAAAVTRAHAAATSARGAGPTVVVEVWTADASADFESEPNLRASQTKTSASMDAARGLFTRLMGDFTGADPAKMRGVCAVHLADLGRELERWRLADEGTGGDSSSYEGTGYVDQSYVLNKVFEVRNPITGGVGGYIGVEGRVVWGEDAQARRQR